MPLRRPQPSARGAPTGRPSQSGCSTNPPCCDWPSTPTFSRTKSWRTGSPKTSPIRRGQSLSREGGLRRGTSGQASSREVLTGAGWQDDQLWTPLRRDLTTPVEQVPSPGVRIEAIRPERVGDRVAVQRAAFTTSTFTEERWHTMAAGAAYADARCLIAYDDQGDAVAAVTVWSAGPGRPGLLEPMGVHRDHRGQGWGRAITLAAAAALQELGSSSAVVCTPSSNEGAVATYASAGFTPLLAVPDLRRSVG